MTARLTSNHLRRDLPQEHTAAYAQSNVYSLDSYLRPFHPSSAPTSPFGLLKMDPLLMRCLVRPDRDITPDLLRKAIRLLAQCQH